MKLRNIRWALICAATAAWAHHGGSMYERDTEIVLENAVVQELRFINPHARLIFLWAPPGEEPEEWEGEMSSPNDFVRAGVYGDVVAPGDRITVRGAPHRTAPRNIRVEAFVLEDGTEILVP